MKLLKNIPSFLAEIHWNDHRDKFHTLNRQRIFHDSDLFIIPEGTLAERFSFRGMELTRFVHPFSFFTLMEQFTKSLTSNSFETGTNWYSRENVTNMVQIGYTFVIEILKKYQGNYKSDMILKRLIQHLEILCSQNTDISNGRFEIVKLYFEANYIMIRHKLVDFAEAFPPLTRKKFFFTFHYHHANKQILFSQIHNSSILLRNLKLEESKNDHSFLILYLKLIQDMIEVST